MIAIAVGDRVKFTQLAIDKEVPAGRRRKASRCMRGVCMGHNVLGGCMVKWDHDKKNIHSYHPDFVELA